MAKIKITGVDKVILSLKDLFENKVADTKLLLDIADFARSRIQSFTRSGKSLVTNSRLKSLSESYKDMRRGAVKYRTLKDGRVIVLPEPDERLKEVDTKFFDPDYSNLTFTGQLLNAIESRIKFADRVVEIFVNDETRTSAYKSKSGRSPKPLTNYDVKELVEKAGRPFLGLDDKGIDRIKKLVLNNIRKQILRKGLKK